MKVELTEAQVVYALEAINAQLRSDEATFRYTVGHGTRADAGRDLVLEGTVLKELLWAVKVARQPAQPRIAVWHGDRKGD